MDDPLAGSGEGLDAGGVEHLGGKVAAEGAPRDAVGGGADVVKMLRLCLTRLFHLSNRIERCYVCALCLFYVF